MGCYSTLTHPKDGRELQFHDGNDWGRYKVGDSVPFVINKDVYGSGYVFDGVYESHSDKGDDDWIIIKDHKIVTVRSRKRNKYEDLYREYDIKEPSRSWWTKAAYQERLADERKRKREWKEYEKTLKGLSPTERMAKMLCFPIRRPFDCGGLASKVLKVTPIEVGVAIKKKKLVSLSDHNQHVKNPCYSSQFEIQNGIACPKCGKELWEHLNGPLLESFPPQRTVFCKACEWRGHRFVEGR